MMAAFRLSELAEKIGGKLMGPADLLIRDVSGFFDPCPETIIFVDDKKKIREAEHAAGAALLIPASVKTCAKPAVAVKNPKLAFAQLLALFHPPRAEENGIHPTAIMDKSVTLGSGVTVGPYAVIRSNAKLGNHVRIGAFSYLDENAVIGDDTIIHPRVTILENVQIGKRCILYEGCVIGSQGFGYATDENGHHIHLPHIGTVIVEDDVEIGANATVDRAVLAVTRIGRGTKIDNQVQVAHNCMIGEDCMIAALAGMSGSSTLGSHSMMGGLTGVRDHVQIGERSAIVGGSMVWGDVEAGSVVSGEPARSHREQLKVYAALQKLPELMKRIETLEKRRSLKKSLSS